ncbi:peptide/nickel transport system permease protein [Deinobacterium chartae]|uniref:Peptide/nickel transport system permease protein n=1 Tax=Deinobacterium chartae TaxID=521158 RepID=A0A841I566_9DEIO|nr:ABC transporter permease [Deinobacterium chartae]MBB6099578.1 peptide/nickel transport system permease protein [Deinobacterium chartae]
MTTFILRRLLNLIPTFIGATLLAFVIVQAAPGDFTTRFLLDPSLDKNYVAELQRQFGLDQPVTTQYLKWLTGVMTGYLGLSLNYQTDVWNVIGPRIANSMVLVIGGVIFLWAVAIPVGVFTAVRQRTTGDYVVSFLSFVGLAVPSFFLALLALFFIVWFNDAVGARILPLTGMRSQTIAGIPFAEAPLYRQWLDILWHALPLIIVSSVDGIAGLGRVMRGQVLDQLNSDYIRTARAKGLAGRVVLYKHALRNAIVPFIAGIGGLLPALVSGAGFVEVVMGWPGLTPLALEALAAQDIYVLMGLTTLTTLLLILGNLLSDLLLAAVDPRIRYS